LNFDRAFERSRGRLFFGDFLLAKQKKDTPAAGKHARREGEYQLKKITNPTCKTKSAASKESASPTPKAFKTIAAQAKTIKKHKPACAPKKQPTPAAGIRARREGENHVKTDHQNQHAKPHLP